MTRNHNDEDEDEDEDEDHGEEVMAYPVRDIFLSSEERYDVWHVKKEERPHLLLVTCYDDAEGTIGSAGTAGKEEKDEDHPTSKDVLPLIDGCDIPGWRHSGLIALDSKEGYYQGILNVGSGCPLLRRESQLPVLSSRATATWKALQQRLLKPPSRTAQRLSLEEAQQLGPNPWFERQNVPVILEGLTNSWKAMTSCTWKSLTETYGNYEWRFSDTHGACMTLTTYHKYTQSLEGQTDESPLAVYDSQLDGDERISLLDDYEVPPCFNGCDLFQCLGEDRRPPYRWILMGPARSGTGLHIDPLGTHAWVTLVEGYKRWVLFPYGTDKATIGMQTPQIPSALWFASSYYDHSMELYCSTAIEILQSPGETVYVPAGWPHLVLNLTQTVAITQNYATEFPTFPRLASAVMEQEPEFYHDWVTQLRISRPDLNNWTDEKIH